MDKPKQASVFRQLATKEVALLTGLLFIGLAVMPVVVYFVGQTVFGTYGGHGYGDFFGRLSTKFRNGDYVAWFLALAPYLGWQILRLLALAWRRTGRSQAAP